MILTRGIAYRDIEDIKSVLFHTQDASHLAMMISRGEFKIPPEEIPWRKETTRDKELFMGNYDIYILLVETVRKHLVAESVKHALSDSSLTGPESDRLIRLADSIEDEAPDFSTPNVKMQPIYGIIYSDGKLIYAGTGLYQHLLVAISDKRYYHTIQNEVVESDNGIEEGLYYSMSEDMTRVYYSKTPADNFKQVGT